MAGMFWVGYFRLHLLKAVGMIASSLLLAIFADILRVVILVFSAHVTGQAETVNHLHDLTGGLSQFLLMATISLLALLLRGRKAEVIEEPASYEPSPLRRSSPALAKHPGWKVAWVVVVWGILTELGVVAWYTLHQPDGPELCWYLQSPPAELQAEELSVPREVRRALDYSAGKMYQWKANNGSW